MSHVDAVLHAATCGMNALLKMALAKAEELDSLAVPPTRQTFKQWWHDRGGGYG